MSLVIGAGIIGWGIAYELAKAGLRVVIAERGDIERESSWAAAGMCIAQRLGHYWLNPLRNEKPTALSSMGRRTARANKH